MAIFRQPIRIGKSGKTRKRKMAFIYFLAEKGRKEPKIIS
jgi:hypothetical protein